jgi:hypothetical protein
MESGSSLTNLAADPETGPPVAALARLNETRAYARAADGADRLCD